VRRVARELAIFAGFLALSIALTWPLAIRLDTAVADLGDPLLNVWIVDWVCHALTHAPLQLFNAPIYHTGLYPLAYSENMVGVALAVLPFHLAGEPAVAVYNIAMLLGFAFSAYGAFVLARLISRSTPGAIVGAIFFAFGSFKFSHLAHLQIIWSGWLPLLLAALLVYWRQPSRKHAALLAGAFLMNGLTNIHWLLFGGFALGVTVVFLQFADARRDRRFWIQLVAALLIASLLLLPFLIPYQLVAKEYGSRRTTAEARLGSASWTDWLIAWTHNRVYGGVPSPELRRAERQLFPGLLVLFLCGAAVILKPRREQVVDDPSTHHSDRTLRALDVTIVLLLAIAYFGALADRVQLGPVHYSGSDVPVMLALVLTIVRLGMAYPRAFGGSLRATVARSRFTPAELSAGIWIVIGVIASLGWNAFLHPFLFRVVTPFRATRTPARWAIIACVGLAVWAAIGVAELLQRRNPGGRRIIAALLVVIATVEVLSDLRWEHVVTEPAAVYRWLQRERPGVVLELPLMGEGVQFRYVLASTIHRVPLINGTSGWETPLHERLRHHEEILRFDDRFLEAIERSGTTIIIVHADSLGERERAVKGWLRAQLAAGRLAFLRRFDHGLSGDYVFAVVRNLANWQRLQAADVPDGAGFLPGQNLARFLAGQPTYSDAITLVVESPIPGDQRGPLTVRGYTVSPHILRKVTVLIDEGTNRYDATLVPRPDVEARLPWYHHAAPNPGFTLVLPKRPDGVPPHTDVQIEVLDNAGRIARSNDLLLEWD
jgi:hypothetical protein